MKLDFALICRIAIAFYKKKEADPQWTWEKHKKELKKYNIVIK